VFAAPRICASVCASLLAACPAPKQPRPVAPEITLDLTRDRGSLRGVAGDAQAVYAAIVIAGEPGATTIEARPSSGERRVLWERTVDGTGGPLTRSAALLGVVVGGTGRAAELELRGNPGTVLLALDAATGVTRWTLAIDASEWSMIAALAPVGDGFVIGGSFAGTLRAGSHVVSSAGKADGFVARVGGDGGVRWLVRVGGAHADAIQGVAAHGDRIAIAGTFASGAELLGEPLLATDERSPKADVFVAELDLAGRRTWSASFGGKLDDSVAGIAIDARGRIAVATIARDALRINLADVTVRGPSDGLVTFFAPDGTAGPTLVFGGLEAVALRAIAASGDRIVVGGVFTGTIALGQRSLTASAGDDAFVAVLDGGTVTHVEPITGPGREELVALAPVPGGYVAGIAHTAGASIGAGSVASSPDPMTGAAAAIRGL
jgi:hypothetical protein